MSESFKVPNQLYTGQFHFQILGPKFSEVDYEAVISSKERLRHVFSEKSKWPETDMSFESNKSVLVRHEKEFNSIEAFAYAVLNLAEDNYIGCMYISPNEQVDYDCEVYMWVKDTEVAWDQALFKTLKDWLNNEWPFKRCAYPSRTINWEDWMYLTKKRRRI